MSLILKATPAELRQGFLALRYRRDIAKLLDVPPSRLVYHLYKTNLATRYEQFEIPKRSGGTRKVSSPATALKLIQRKLNHVLHSVYECKPPVHGFTLKKGIVTNASSHRQ